MKTSRPLLAAAAFCAAAIVGAQAAPPPTAPPQPAPKVAKAPLDFSGVWELDAKESKGVSKNMEKAVISIRQNGDRIWIEPIEQKRPWLVADELVVDGKVYEKAIGGGKKGSVQSQWGKDKKSLWIQTTASTEENPDSGWTRAVWELKDGGKTWTRRTWSFSQAEKRESFLVFRKRKPAVS
ncbi:MAG TPA: hypothetical protein VMT25_04350 [Thermoanaerobaculia bacterium]|nr:hypothetical protein [Thermoanaerobaculia bacterium]